MEILKFLESSPFVQAFEVIDHRRWENGQYTRLTIQFVDQSVLFVREYHDATSRNYSYHWQSFENQLYCRWDNAPHYPEHLTFPHHKHFSGNVVESREITLEEVLKIIEKKFPDLKIR